MSDIIRIFDRDEVEVTTVASNSITLAFDSNGLPSYGFGSPILVGYILAQLTSSGLTVTATGTSLVVNNIRATANGDGVTSMLGWTVSGSDLVLTFTTPGTRYQEMEWSIGDEVPPIKLTVKIVRQ